MAMPSGVERVLGLTELREHVYKTQVRRDTYKPEEFNFLKTDIPGVSATVKRLLSEEKSVAELSIGSGLFLLSQATVTETGWKLMVLADKKQIMQPIVSLERNAKRIGYAAIGGMVLFYFLFLMYLLYNAGRIAKLRTFYHSSRPEIPPVS